MFNSKSVEEGHFHKQQDSCAFIDSLIPLCNTAEYSPWTWKQKWKSWQQQWGKCMHVSWKQNKNARASLSKAAPQSYI